MKSRIATCVAVITLAAWFGCSGEPGADNSYDPNNDSVRPAVLSVSPDGGAVAVSVNEKITASMSEDIDTLSITSDNVVLLDGSRNIVAGVISYSGRKITITPVEKMNHCQEYTVVLTDRIRDIAGNTLGADYVSTFTTEISFEPQMVRVEGTAAGDPFQMGSSAIAGLSIPVHAVEIGPFYIGKTEVTFDEFDEFCVATGREKPLSNFGRGFMPVINVTWFDAVDYCNWLSDAQGLTPCYYREGPEVKWVDDDGGLNCTGYRLPTEAEWEFAARERGVTDPAGFSGYWLGMTELNDYAWHSLNSDGVTHEVANRNPNQLGVYDMSGNVAEWCWDWFADEYYQNCYDLGTVDNPHGAPANTNHRKIIRGGSWESVAADNGVATGARNYRYTTNAGSTVGFRVSRNE
ncbi:MAG TPA: SUMF1/EgtB/PvdO family nonheme iron enzyme [Spirochaetota bacterium]|nr:SUMF1/EgtB/PvdO family nonheme iron enzyme [Spirochaetota bacterium]